MSGQLNELRLQVERLDYDNKESIITIDILKEQNQDTKGELDELKKTITELKSSQKDASVEDKEKRKQEKMAMMMAKFDTVSIKAFVACPPQCLIVIWDFSKERSPRRMSSFVSSWRSSTPSTMRLLCLLFPSTISLLFAGSYLKDSHSSAKPSTA